MDSRGIEYVVRVENPNVRPVNISIIMAKWYDDGIIPSSIGDTLVTRSCDLIV